MNRDNLNYEITNVLVIGCGGAGLRAAIEVKRNNISVSVLGKRAKNDAHTVLAAGGINASFGNKDHEDSWEQHFADTYVEGYELGDPEIIEFMAKNALDQVSEISKWGADFEKLGNGKFDQRFFGAHTFRRTCYAGDYTGQEILNTLLNKCEELKIPLIDSEYVTDLLVENNICFGAISFNIHTGQKTIHIADSVILCTGGHTRLWKKSSSRKLENMGDGYFLALKAGCDLVDMEMVQFHPTGMLYPEEVAGTLVTEAVRGEGGILLNGKGERYMKRYDKVRMELSTRDRVAIANYTEIIEGRTSPSGGVFLDISHKNKDFIINKIPKIYRQFLESQFLDISKEPMEVAPTAHYSMGGIFVRSPKHDTNINGLFCAGEVSGGLHGANRLGGNSLAEILVFGKVAGHCAASYSKNLTSPIRSKRVIDNASNEISKHIKTGEFIPIALQEDLRNIMWRFCGVVKSKEMLRMGLTEIEILEKKANNLDVRITQNNFNDLVAAFDLKASLITSKATILSALHREESRGAHYRSDYKEISKKYNYNIILKFTKGKLVIKTIPLKNTSNSLKSFINKAGKIISYKGKLLE